MSKSKTLLGFEDEFITAGFKDVLNHTTNKIGGKPDFPSNISTESPKCRLCRLPILLVAQIYAPLDITYDRTLYLFGCINAKCWSSSQSWTCLRVQVKKETAVAVSDVTCSSATSSNTAWCSDADNWGEDDTDENSVTESTTSTIGHNVINVGIENLSVNDGRGLQIASAEIDLEGNELVRVDTPPTSEVDIGHLLRESAPLPPRTSGAEFLSFFLSVWEEDFPQDVDPHAEELLLKYREKNDLVTDDRDQTGGGAAECYEKSLPAHGDKMFHQFLSKVRDHPGQLLRYSREGDPLLLDALKNAPDKCPRCHDESVFEFQLLSTIIPKLRLISDVQQCGRLDFGTVLVYTCKNSCRTDDSAFNTETVIVQHEKY